MRVRNTAAFSTRLGALTLRPGEEADLSDHLATRFLGLLPHLEVVEPETVAVPVSIASDSTPVVPEAPKPKAKRKRSSKKKAARSSED